MDWVKDSRGSRVDVKVARVRFTDCDSLLCVAAASAKVCYSTMNTIPVCKKVEFTINPAALTQQTEAKVLLTLHDKYTQQNF